MRARPTSSSSRSPKLSTEHGRIAAFDADKGFGEVEAEDGRRLFFHCTQIADGTRTIAVGTEVTFEVVPGQMGQWEGAEITPMSTTPGRAPLPAPPR